VGGAIDRTIAPARKRNFMPLVVELDKNQSACAQFLDD
jgi:hypothetical protein